MIRRPPEATLLPWRSPYRAVGQRGPDTPAAVVRCILDSLAHAYARTAAQAEKLSSHHAEVIHVVGGGCQNELDRKNTRLNSSHANISYAVFCLKKTKTRTYS